MKSRPNCTLMRLGSPNRIDVVNRNPIPNSIVDYRRFGFQDLNRVDDRDCDIKSIYFQYKTININFFDLNLIF